MLSLRHYMIFKEVSSTENFTRAAQNLYITQSAVSHTIRELEEYTGTLLFDRLSKKVRLTAAGKLLLEEITPILTACRSLEQKIRRLDLQAPINIVSSITLASYWLPGILNRFKTYHPNVPVYVNVVSAANALQALHEGNADLALVEGATPHAPFESFCFAEYNLKILCAPTYLSFERPPASISEFCSRQLLLREPGSAIRDALDSKLLLSGYKAHPAWTSVNSSALIEAAKAGLGITVLPEVLVKKELADKTLVSVEIKDLIIRNQLLAVWHKDKHMTTPLRSLISCIH
ncbi:HTH-type transcriptional activator CmpR [uncultured Roseburia sp.]|uniref:LysR family transcriptional regulator n=1 Tax=Brotonthovivens ammoniilytica TaxID=2981725 RepID=A0ABT2TQJ3_9FIRM|nr:LysR family transcriptional regulator [Brotonthovivens ammoniilytica]MCU6763739.1 LysR family transcriptional regulator [Brotonthovivens ammoniilytica]SCJ33363.1 HTH-type transcriptional activator CmpR [uncultured Roseburia sp.]